MNPTQTSRLVSPHTVLPPTGERSRPETPQIGTSVSPSVAALPASVHIGNLTLHVGHVMTALSDSEAQVLHWALHSETPKETFAHSPDEDGVYSCVIGAKDYFECAHLPRQYPERMMLSCELDASLGLKSVVISDLNRDLKMGQVYCRAYFDHLARATQTPTSEQAASSMASLPPSRTNLSFFTNSELTNEFIQRHNPQDFLEDPLPSQVSNSAESMTFTHDNSADTGSVSLGPIRAHRSDTNRTQPYPASSQSGSASEVTRRIRRKGATDEQLSNQTRHEDGSLKTQKEVANDLHGQNIGADNNRIVKQLRGTREVRRKATDEDIVINLRREDGTFKKTKQVVDDMHALGLGVAPQRVVAQLKAAGALRESATKEQINKHLRRDDGSLKTQLQVANDLRKAGLAVTTMSITEQLQEARGGRINRPSASDDEVRAHMYHDNGSLKSYRELNGDIHAIGLGVESTRIVRLLREAKES